jgi:NAD(P)H-flavin reductase
VELQNMATPMPHAPGQLCKIHCFDGKGRYFSIISNPSIEEEIRIHLRISKNTSEAVLELTKPGHRVQLGGPYGEMHKLIHIKKTRILIAEGLGLSAFHSLLDHSHEWVEDTHLVWIRDEIDKNYANANIEKCKNSLISFNTHILDNTEHSLSHCLDYCQDIIQKNKEVVLAFAGSPQAAMYLEKKFLSTDHPNSLEFVSDVLQIRRSELVR